MKNIRNFSKVLFYICKVYGWLLLITAVYMAGVLILAHSRDTSLLVALPGNRFTISYPFTTVPFLIGDFNANSITIMLAALVGYGCFSLLLANVFKVFRQEKLFTREGVKALTTFYMLNFIVPVVVLIISFFTVDDIRDFIALSVLHGIIGVFAWFMANIFKQGVALQDEQDHTL